MLLKDKHVITHTGHLNKLSSLNRRFRPRKLEGKFIILDCPEVSDGIQKHYADKWIYVLRERKRVDV